MIPPFGVDAPPLRHVPQSACARRIRPWSFTDHDVEVSHKAAKRDRQDRRASVAALVRTPAELLEHLREQATFLRLSGAAFDSGFEGEAKRLAVTIRVLVHDTNRSMSLLTQMGVKDQLLFVDTAPPIDPRNILGTEGLVVMRNSAAGSSYVAPLDDVPSERLGRTKRFAEWWGQPVTCLPDGKTVSRRAYVLPAANQEGGAHVDAKLSSLYDDFARRNPFGWMTHSPADQTPLQGHGALASVRQIAHELQSTIAPLLAR